MLWEIAIYRYIIVFLQLPKTLTILNNVTFGIRRHFTWMTVENAATIFNKNIALLDFIPVNI